MNEINSRVQDLSKIIAELSSDPDFSQTVSRIITTMVEAFSENNKVFFCGNGGSAAEAQHLAAELSGKFKLNRKALPAEACHLNLSFLTAVSNDYDFTKAYERYVEAFGSTGDILIGLTTSGNSENIVNAFNVAQKNGLTTVALTGKKDGRIKDYSDLVVNVPSDDVPRIQEAHLLIGHIICEAVEKELFGNKISD